MLIFSQPTGSMIFFLGKKRHDVGCAEKLSCDSVRKNSGHRIVSATIPSFNIFLINNIKSHLKIKQLSCIIYLEVIGIESPIALSKNDYKK